MVQFKLNGIMHESIIDQGTPQNIGETILLHFLVDMMVLIKNQEGVEL